MPVVHVSRSGLPPAADDRLIWERARQHGFMIITNDEDFHRSASVYGFPPKVVLLCTSNQSTNHISEVLAKHMDDIERLAVSSELGLLELY